MWPDDDQLLAALGDAVRAAQDVPPQFVAAGQAAYAWRTIDAELAALTYDSALSENAGRQPAGTRAEPAVLRGLTFTSDRLTVEIQPAQAGQAEVQLVTGTSTVIRIDSIGWFALRPAPGVAFRLRFRTGSEDVLTSWVTP